MPTTDVVDSVISAAAGATRKRAAATSLPVKKATSRSPKNPNFKPISTRQRDSKGRYISGTYYEGGVTEVTDAFGNVSIRALPSGSGTSRSARVKNLQQQRKTILASIKAVQARRKAGERFPKGTIKTLRESAKQIRVRLQLAKGL